MFSEVTIVGFVGRDPEQRATPSGRELAEFSIASNERDRKVWFTCTVWGNAAAVVYEHVRKGDFLLVKGKLQADDNGNPAAWISGDGEPRSRFKVNVNEFKFLPKSHAVSDQTLDEIDGDQTLDDIPF